MGERGGACLLVGAGGFLGAWLARGLARAGPVLLAGRDPGRDLPPALAARLAEEGALCALDAARPGALAALLDARAPRAVLLSAALARIADCARAPELARRLNAELPAEAARWCARAGARLVLVSTDLVFGGAPPPPAGFAEDAPPAPLHEYGRTKAEGERALLASDAPALVVRLPLLCGPSFGRGLGASDALVAAVARGERPLLFADEERTPLDVRDAARALVECLAGERRGVLHVAGPRRLSRLALGLLALRAAGLDQARARAAVRAATRAEAGLAHERAADVALDAALARATLATPLRDVEEALADRET